MATSRSAWQRRERQAALLFGATRQPGSGSMGLPGRSRSDSDHPVLYIETKLRERHAVRSLHDATRELADREDKVPVLALADKSRPGFLLVIDSRDLPALVAEFSAAQAAERLVAALAASVEATA